VNSSRISPSYRPEAVTQKSGGIIPNHPTTYAARLLNQCGPPPNLCTGEKQ
jgi:hypothetical protein